MECLTAQLQLKIDNFSKKMVKSVPVFQLSLNVYCHITLNLHLNTVIFLCTCKDEPNLDTRLLFVAVNYL